MSNDFIVDIREIEESFVIHFGGEFETINAYTLATALVSIADAAKEANSLINYGFEIEVVVEALGSGSFKAKIKTIYYSAGNIFSKQNLKSIVLSIIATYIYQNTLAPDSNVNIVVSEESVIIEHCDKKIIIPRTVHEALEHAKKSANFKRKIGQVFEAAEKDDKVESLGISKDMNDVKPVIEVPRDMFHRFHYGENDENDDRQFVEHAKLLILRAILTKSKRRWEFVWRGVTISAPILCPKFYDDFIEHKITIAPGDALEVKMKIYQEKDKFAGVYKNIKYEIVEVLDHIPKLKQKNILINSM